MAEEVLLTVTHKLNPLEQVYHDRVEQLQGRIDVVLEKISMRKRADFIDGRYTGPVLDELAAILRGEKP